MKTRLILFILLCSCASVQSQNLFTQHKFHRLDESQDLTNNIINDIAQDSLGYIWVATEGGLLRYQGFKFKTYQKDRTNVLSLPHNLVYRVYVDDKNQIWALTDQGVAKYSYHEDKVTRFKPEEISVGITAMAMDEDKKYYFGGYSGGVWVGRDSLTHLQMIDSKTGQDLSQEQISQLKICNQTLWVAFRSQGMVKYDLNTGEVVYFHPDLFHHGARFEIIDFLIDAKRMAWVATNRGLVGIKSDSTGAYDLDNILEGQLPVDDYLSIHQDDNGKTWLGTRQHGMYAFELDQAHRLVGSLEHFEPQPDDSGISHRTISKIFCDDSGLMWLGTHNGGVNVFNSEGEEVRYLTHSQSNSQTLSYENIWGLAPSSDGEYWVGTDGKGLNTLNPKTGEVSVRFQEQLANKAILSLLEDDQSRLWAGTYEDGLYLIDLKSNQVKNYRKGGAMSELLVDDIRVIHQMDNGKILIGTNYGGLYWFDEHSERVLLVEGSSWLDVRSIERVNERIFYLGSFSSGLMRAELLGDVWRIEEVKGEGTDERLVVSDICALDNNLWLATRENGLVRYDVLARKYHFFEDQAILRNVAVSGLVSDQKGNLWLTTNSGIYSYNVRSEEVTVFDTMDGIQPGHFNYGSILLSSEGYLVAGGIHGMNLFYPGQVLQELPQLPVIFNELKVLNEKMTPINSEVFVTGESIFLTKEIKLNHTDNVFSISYSIPGFNKGKQNKFEYMLEGYDAAWQVNNGVNEATYRNVPYGNYTFRVKSIYDDKVSNALKVSISAPFWRTWEAYLLMIVSLAIVLWRFVKFNNVRITLRQQLKFEQELREKDHHLMQEKLRFYTNFSHELKTPLTLIQGPVNDLIKKEQDPQHFYYLQLIKKNTSILLKFIGRMLEFRKVEMNQGYLNVGCYDLNILAQEEAESFTYLAKEKDIPFGFYSESNLNVWVDIEKVQIVINNLLSNAIKFSSPGEKVQFGVFQEGSSVIIEVKDQGEGIKPEELGNIFSPFYQASNSAGSGGTGIGLALSKNFVEAHGGEITVDSSSAGSVFRVGIPLGKEHLLGKDNVRFIASGQTESLEIESLTESFVIDGKPEVISDADKVMLVVDDNRDIAAYISSIFSADFKVIQADNGQDAFDKSINSMPDIIISDMMMPEMDGLELCKKLKSNIATSHVPIILLTAKNSNESKMDGYGVGADDYMTKPFNSDLLKVRVANILSRRKLLALKYTSGDLVEQNEQVSKEKEFILQVEATIIAMLDSAEFNVPDLCKELGMSQTSLYRKIKSLTDDSIQIFIRKIKIKRAAHMLVAEDMTVTEVAIALNFSDLKYFRKCFKEQFDQTPSEYKNDHAIKPQTVNINNL
ncbi:hybrid sensor histidine kinase/response regulator transcription factor [Reichenbachiella sp. MSK19-1]|uniref:hybrid sensor histidine kinase/response regulator transcription factor n=1 Tax=Reichenbachiella sp. MSK19-1 TaxID=1897631 RepID=UPI000E6CF882|nr:hybrid sensor histidine kinase/response regulator transcription factor [Reichenbachiella sp. MSK19-1]